MKQTLYGMTRDQIASLTSGLGMPRFAAGQIVRWLYRRGIAEISGMSDLSLRHRELLAEHCDLGLSAPLSVQCSADGTKKYLFATSGGHYIESAYIPDGERATLCVSSQAGCRMGCRFCMTGRQGLQQNLSTAEILNQIVSLPERETLTNVVLMGMGEPLDNTGNVLQALDILTAEWGFGWSPGRITLSTSGVLPGLGRFLEESRVHLAVSLHNPFHEERLEIMPIENRYPITEVVNLIRRYDFTRQRRVSFEYIILQGINDSDRHIRGLARLLNGLNCRINIIRFHAIPGSPYASPPDDEVVRFRDALIRKGITATVRASRGEDIQAACGLLSTAGQERRNADAI